MRLAHLARSLCSAIAGAESCHLSFRSRAKQTAIDGGQDAFRFGRVIVHVLKGPGVVMGRPLSFIMRIVRRRLQGECAPSQCTHKRGSIVTDIRDARGSASSSREIEAPRTAVRRGPIVVFLPTLLSLTMSRVHQLEINDTHSHGSALGFPKSTSLQLIRFHCRLFFAVSVSPTDELLSQSPRQNKYRFARADVQSGSVSFYLPLSPSLSKQ